MRANNTLGYGPASPYAVVTAANLVLASARASKAGPGAVPGAESTKGINGLRARLIEAFVEHDHLDPQLLGPLDQAEPTHLAAA